MLNYLFEGKHIFGHSFLRVNPAANSRWPATYIWNCDYVMGSENIWICLQIRNIVVYYITEHQMVKLHAYISPT